MMRSCGCSVLVSLILTLAGGCGAQVTTFQARIRAADGSPIYVEDILAITEDTNLTTEEQRQALRDLGLEDEELITALLGE